MKKIALIPIDNRPVCYMLPKMIAAINDEITLVMPDRRLLGSLTKNADREALFDWLEEVKNVDYLVISADTLIYGGLIPSRRCRDTFEEIEKRVLRLRNILLGKNNCKTFVFTSIMRISDNNINEEEKEYWLEWGEKIFEYSYNLHRATVEGNSNAKEKAMDISSEIPKEVLIDWLGARARNFEVNKLYLKLYDEKFIDTLIYSKDDCAEFGLNVKEAGYFCYEAEKRNGVFVKTGADEIPLTLLTRCLTDGQKVKIAPVYTQPEGISRISKYEDITLAESVKSQILTAGAIVSELETADLILYINNFKSEQGELVMNIEAEGFSGKIQKFDKPYFVVDVMNANGADNKFVEELLSQGIGDFYGYAAWNTTGNALGSGISAAIFKLLSKNHNEKAFKRLQTVRFLEDWAYQANLRKEFKTKNMTDEKAIKKLFTPYEKIVKRAIGIETEEIKYSNPWNRYFEIEITV